MCWWHTGCYMQNWGLGAFVLQTLTFDIVIATRNRPDALAVSIPLMLDQSRQPKQLIIIDSSDNHEAVRRAVDEATAGWGGRVIVEHTGTGTPFQRGRGLSLVTSDVAIIPDDDSLFFPGTSEAIIAVYERDTEGKIAGVAAEESALPPDSVDLSESYQPSPEHLREVRIKPYRYNLEKRFRFLNPKVYLGFKLAELRDVPEWLGEMNALPAAYLTGFRMSFRTSAIRKAGFDPTLTGYTLEDDVDASYSAARNGLLVVARDAQIFHHLFPGGRGSGFRMGRTSTLNLLYVGLKHAENPEFSVAETASIRLRLRVFMMLQLLVGLTRIRTRFGRTRLAGTWAAIQSSGPLWAAAPETLSAAYAQATERANRKAPRLDENHNTGIVAP